MGLKRTRIVDGVECSTPEFFEAIRAVNFITRYKFNWAINPKEVRDYDLEQMIEHARIIASERGLRLAQKTGLTGFIQLDVINE
ncbi:hypothetical protein [Paenibacillus macerans]|uniref:Uncharacterized protein n=1 Tax=Paenibacillus macerans TaxID=44252 RepID=A0A090Y2J9_PAEMA|nr:hypothetical protein [Paenibacillus macerans]KFM92973.1 hypothetical protein DJ90_2981 [Paenibacillus macerans]MCY7561584.1 hypothetical protein [Paenibacillus macerans]MEC0153317.1 hypothetical protein [Paenibacillus macerans]SUA84829.1 Uncharacterised protein [Paenibacillus macerans]